jgi:hypothetical protein
MKDSHRGTGLTEKKKRIRNGERLIFHSPGKHHIPMSDNHSVSPANTS